MKVHLRKINETKNSINHITHTAIISDAQNHNLPKFNPYNYTALALWCVPISIGAPREQIANCI